MRITFLGTGTSQGIPVIGCTCPACTSENPQDKRLRVSIKIELDDETTIVVDCGPDFRQQMLQSKTTKINALLITHEHSDHVAGLDDIRPFNFRYNMDMPVYTLPRVQENLKERFRYIFAATYPGVPRVVQHAVTKDTPFKIGKHEIIPIEIWHGGLPILGFRIGDFAYLTDFKSITDEEAQKLNGIYTIVISALQKEPHHSHANLEQALDFVAQQQIPQAYLTHLSHQMGPVASIQDNLPANVQVAYDGLQIEV